MFTIIPGLQTRGTTYQPWFALVIPNSDLILINKQTNKQTTEYAEKIAYENIKDSKVWSKWIVFLCRPPKTSPGSSTCQRSCFRTPCWTRVWEEQNGARQHDLRKAKTKNKQKTVFILPCYLRIFLDQLVRERQQTFVTKYSRASFLNKRLHITSSQAARLLLHVCTALHSSTVL